MLITILIGVVGAAAYSLRMLLMKLRFELSGGKVQTNHNRIPFVIFSNDKRYRTAFEPICRELDNKWDVSINNGNTFLPSTWLSVKDDIWNKDNWTFINETVVLNEHAAP